MIPIPTHELIYFLEWIKSNNIILNDEFEYEELLQLAEKFLYSNQLTHYYLKHQSEQVNTLYLLMYILQTTTELKDDDIIHTFEEFLNNPKYLFTLMNYVKSTKKLLPQIDLHPLLKGFIEYCHNPSVSYLPFNRFIDKQVSWFHPRMNCNWKYDWYMRTLNNFSDILSLKFNEYISRVDLSLVEDFISNRVIINDFDDIIKCSYQFKDNYNNTDYEPICYKNGLKEEATRLANSIADLLKNKLNNLLTGHEDTKISYLLTEITSTPRDLVGSIAFFEWLQNNSTYNLSSISQDELIKSFCKDTGYENNRVFRNQVKNWLNNRQGFNFLYNILDFLHIKSKNSQSDQLNRYIKVKYHAILLFDHPYKFRSFIDLYRPSLNSLTFDDLDIYFSKDDFDGKSSGYDTIRALERLYKIEFISVPCIVLWKESIKNSIILPFKNLNEEAIFNVIKHIVYAIQTDRNLVEISNYIKENYMDILQSSIINNIMKNEGGINNVSININNGQALVLENKGISNNVVTQTQLGEQTLLTTEQLEEINKFAQHLAKTELDDIEDFQRFEVASILSKLAKSSKEIDPKAQCEYSIKWKNWIKDASDKALKALSIAADIATLSPVVTKFLLGQN